MCVTFDDIVEEALKPLEPVDNILLFASIDESQNLINKIGPIQYLEEPGSDSFSSTRSIDEAAKAWDNNWSIKGVVESHNANICQKQPKQYSEIVQRESNLSLISIGDTENVSNIGFTRSKEMPQTCDGIPIQNKKKEPQNQFEIIYLEEAESVSTRRIGCSRTIKEETRTRDNIRIQLINVNANASTVTYQLPEHTIKAEKKISDKILFIKSKDKYFNAYDNFMQWNKQKNMSLFSEKTLLAYIHERSKRFKPPSLWSTYTMLRSAIMFRHGIDIKEYQTLFDFLKMQSHGYKPKKAKVLTAADIEIFLNSAPDKTYLATKVSLIFGITGACSRADLANITTEDVEAYADKTLVKICNSKTEIPKKFFIHGKHSEIVKRYQSIRLMRGGSNRFFLNFRNGKCTAQNIGINKFGMMPKEIALYLNLPDPESYTGRSFKSTSATLFLQNYNEEAKCTN